MRLEDATSLLLSGFPTALCVFAPFTFYSPDKQIKNEPHVIGNMGHPR